MKAAILSAPGRFEVAERIERAPGSGEVLVRIEGCGVCASNLGPWSGLHGMEYPLEPGSPGHEVYGVVEAVGAGVDASLTPGAAVTALTYNGFAELDVARADDVVPLPPSLAGKPVLGEPVACAVNVAKRAGVREGDTVVVLGVGFLGALLLQLVRAARPARVVAVSRRRDALDVAARLGADELLSFDDDVRGRVHALTGGELADVVIEATGKQNVLDLAAELTRVRGRLVIAGYHQDGARTVNMQLWNWRGLDVINAHERDPRVYTEGMREGVRLIEAGLLEPEALVSHFFPLADINDAFRAAEARPAGFFKAVVSP